MSDDEQKPGKVLRTSAGSTRLTAGGAKPSDQDAEGPRPQREGEQGTGDGPAAGKPGKPKRPQYGMRGSQGTESKSAEAKPGEAKSAEAKRAGDSEPAPAAKSAQRAPEAPAAGGREAAEEAGGKSGDADARTIAMPAGRPGASEASESDGGATAGAGAREERPAGVAGAERDGAKKGPGAPPKKQVRISGPNSKGAQAQGSQTAVQPRVDDAPVREAEPRGSQPSGATGAAAAGAGAGAAVGAGAGAPRGGVQRTAGQGSQRGSAPQGASAAPRGEGESVRASSSGVKMGGSAKKKGPRTVKLTVSKIDPWSVMKMTFLLSVAIGIATVIAALVLWLVLQATGTLQNLQSTLGEIAGTESADQLLSLFGLGRILSFAIILAVVNIVLMTALSTLFALLYNIGASIVGGFHLTLSDD